MILFYFENCNFIQLKIIDNFRYPFHHVWGEKANNHTLANS